MIDNILSRRKYEESPIRRFTNRDPPYVNEMKTFGEVAIATIRKKIRSKLVDRGEQ